MKHRSSLFGLMALLLCASSLAAGPYSPAAGREGSDAIAHDDPRFVSWATEAVSYNPGTNLTEEFMVVEEALGPSEGILFHPNGAAATVSLGRGGSITVTFDRPIANGEGWDFVVFENAVGPTFLELGYVEVSSDGVHFVRFPSTSLTASSVPGFGALDPTNVDGLAGKYVYGYGAPFDLEKLAGSPGLDIDHITHVRVIDIVGDGSARDSEGRIIYDPYPTVGSAGFDLDAVGVRYQAPPAVPALSAHVEGNQLLLTWTTEPGATYTLQRSTDLATWEAVAVHAGTGTEVTEPVALSAEEAYYRVVAE